VSVQGSLGWPGGGRPLALLSRRWRSMEEALALDLHHENARGDNPGLGGGGLFLRRKWPARFVAGLADLFSSSSPNCELGR
jgi:hypothetical protein